MNDREYELENKKLFLEARALDIRELELAASVKQHELDLDIRERELYLAEKVHESKYHAEQRLSKQHGFPLMGEKLRPVGNRDHEPTVFPKEYPEERFQPGFGNRHGD